MYARLLEAPRSSFFLLGPRGTGKTTWLRQKFAGATWFNLLDEGLYQRLLANPSLFGDALRAVPAGSWVVVDEIQRLPGLLNEVHRAIEERKLKFALTGSSARKLRQAGTNLLAGRALRRAMFPLVPPELGRDFSLEKALRIGTLPLVWDSPEPEETLRTRSSRRA
jgi:predicted AAA+ superfamily ATPase